MAGELTAAFTGGNRLHENKTAIRTITLSSGGSPVDLTAYSNFRSRVIDLITQAHAGGAPAFDRTATVTVTDGPNGVLSWRLEKADTLAMAATKTGGATVTFVTDIVADFTATVGRIDYLGQGNGTLQQEVTTSG